MKKILFILLILILPFFPLFSDSIDLLLSNAVENIENNISENLIIGIGNIVYSDKEIGSEFSHFLKEKLSIAIQRSERFELSDTDNLDLIKEQWDFQHSGFVDEDQAVRIGELDAVQALLLGNYFDNESTINIFLKLVDVETGSVLAAEEIVISKRDIHVSVIPDNYNNALYIIDELSEVSNTNSSQPIVNAWIEKGNGATYENGENLFVNFYSVTGCYIKVYHIDVNGQTQLIFPNSYYSNNFINANIIYSIPDGRYPFKFSLGEPFGTEFIKVIASPVQFAEIEESFSNLGNASQNLLFRGLTVEQTQGELTEILLNYTIIE